MKNVLIVGGSYFVGRVFVEELSKIPGYAIYVMNRGNVPLGIDGINEIRCDRHDAQAMNEAVPSLIWSAVVDFCAYTPDDISTMFSVLPGHAIFHYIFISTASVYAKTNELPVCEGAPKVSRPMPVVHGDYAYNKRLAEEELKRRCRQGNTPWTIFRPTFIYGKHNYAPRESYFFDLILRGETVILPDNGLSLFTFVSVWDVARAIIGCLDNRNVHKRTFILSGKELVSYRRFLEVLGLVTGKDIHTESMSVEEIIGHGIALPFPLDEHLVYCGDRISKDTGFSYMPFTEGMRATYQWYSRVRSNEI
ncbi:MAG TPA: NAD-dependent epimerase/dehydratase family protein [Deltaproteobacteria bacterium]|nr:NAD-dependent epimerase/dehydratase family protein [Deltaproteobacteria bacterium]